MTLLTAGCGLVGPDCDEENRNLRLEKDFGGGFRAVVALDQRRDADSKQATSREMGWIVQGSLDAGVVTEIHLHQGQSGPLLATLPIVNASATVFSSGQVFSPDFLEMSFDEFYAILRTQPVHVELHTTTAPQGIPLGSLSVEEDNDWFHPFCS